MDVNRLTEKAQDAVRQAQALAQRHGQSGRSISRSSPTTP